MHAFATPCCWLNTLHDLPVPLPGLQNMGDFPRDFDFVPLDFPLHPWDFLRNLPTCPIDFPLHVFVHLPCVLEHTHLFPTILCDFPQAYRVFPAVFNVPQRFPSFPCLSPQICSGPPHILPTHTSLHYTQVFPRSFPCMLSSFQNLGQSSMHKVVRIIILRQTIALSTSMPGINKHSTGVSSF